MLPVVKYLKIHKLYSPNLSVYIKRNNLGGPVTLSDKRHFIKLMFVSRKHKFMSV